MKKLPTAAHAAMTCAVATALTGCGGGSSSSTSAVPNVVTISQQGGSNGAVGQSVTVNWSNTQSEACTGSGALSGDHVVQQRSDGDR